MALRRIASKYAHSPMSCSLYVGVGFTANGDDGAKNATTNNTSALTLELIRHAFSHWRERLSNSNNAAKVFEDKIRQNRHRHLFMSWKNKTAERTRRRASRASAASVSIPIFSQKVQNKREESLLKQSFHAWKVAFFIVKQRRKLSKFSNSPLTLMSRMASVRGHHARARGAQNVSPTMKPAMLSSAVVSAPDIKTRQTYSASTLSLRNVQAVNYINGHGGSGIDLDSDSDSGSDSGSGVDSKYIINNDNVDSDSSDGHGHGDDLLLHIASPLPRKELLSTKYPRAARDKINANNESISAYTSLLMPMSSKRLGKTTSLSLSDPYFIPPHRNQVERREKYATK